MVAGISGASCGCAVGCWSGLPPNQLPMLPELEPAHPASASAETTAATGGERRPNVPMDMPLLYSDTAAVEAIHSASRH